MLPRTPQDRANPAVVPRNHVLVGVIGEAEAGNYEPLRRLARACLVFGVFWVGL